MPKPIENVEMIYLSGLLEKVIRKSNLPLSCNESFHHLKDKIFKESAETISLSTLKRLFNGNELNNPTKASLDVLAKYVEFHSWKNYLSNVRQQDKYLLQHSLSIIITTKTIDLKQVTGLCEKYGHLPEIYPFIFTVIRLASEQKHKDFFLQFFSLSNLFNKHYHTEYDFYYLGQSITLAMRENEELAKEMTTTYCNNPLAIQYCLESFVDEDYLDGYYGIWLDEYHKHKKDPQSLAFYYALKYKQAFMTNKKEEATQWYKLIVAFNPDKPLCNIVEERCLAIRLIEEKHQPDAKQDEIFSRLVQIECSRKGEYKGCQLYLLRYLYMAQKYDWMCTIVNLFDQHSTKTDEHWLLKHANALLLYKAFAYHLQNQPIKAAELFHKVDTHLFDPFIYQSMMNDFNAIKATLGL